MRRHSRGSEEARAPGSVPRTDLLLLGALIAAITSIYAIYALHVGNFQDDEELYMQLARYIARHFPSSLWQSGIYPRGSQRLDQIILAVPFSLLRGPGAFTIGHVIQSLLFVSTALPVFLLARRAGLQRAASLLAATLSTVVPWAVVSTSFLAESAAYPAYAWVLYTSWLTVRRPSARNDALALLALVVAALSRTAMLALAPILPLVVLWHEWSWEMRGRAWASRARELPARVWSRHPLLTTAVGLALLVFAVGKLGLLPGRGLSALTGDYGVPHVEALSSLLSRYRQYISRMAAGTGYLAVAVALPWVLGTLVRPRDGERHALAVVCALGGAVILLSLLQAGPDERYVLYGAVPIALATAAALADWTRAPGPSMSMVLGVIVGAVVVVMLIDGTTWPALANPYDFFTYPAATFYERVLVGHVELLHIPLVHLAPDRLLEAGIILLASIFALVGGRPRAALPAAALLGVALVALGATQTLYGLRKFTVAAGEANGPNAAARSWVDRHVPSNVTVGALAVSLGETSAYVPIWRATDFWNTSVQLGTFFESPGALPLPLGIDPRRLTVQNQSGLLSGSRDPGRPSPALVPHYLLVPRQGTNRVGLEDRLVAQDPYLPLDLVLLDQPARIDWSLSGTSPEGFLTSEQAATATVYSGALTGGVRHCATFSLIAPPGFPGRWSYRVTSGGHSLRHGTLVAEQASSIIVPLFPRTSPRGPSTKVLVKVKGSETFVNGLVVSAKLAFFSVGKCPVSRSS